LFYIIYNKDRLIKYIPEYKNIKLDYFFDRNLLPKSSKQAYLLGYYEDRLKRADL